MLIWTLFHRPRYNEVGNLGYIVMLFRFLKLYRQLVPKGTEFETIEIGDIDEEFIKSISLKDLYAFIQFTEDYRKNSNNEVAKVLLHYLIW